METTALFTHVKPLHVHGFVDVTPRDVQLHIVLPEIVWILVAAINPHKALSCGYTHTVLGMFFDENEEAHIGAQINPGLLLLAPVPMIYVAKLDNWHVL